MDSLSEVWRKLPVLYNSLLYCAVPKNGRARISRLVRNMPGGEFEHKNEFGRWVQTPALHCFHKRWCDFRYECKSAEIRKIEGEL